MTLTLTPDLERRLAREAQRVGKTPDEYALDLLDKQLPSPLTTETKNTGLAALLQSWIDEGDEEEQRETFEALKNGLNETRAANGERIIYP
jgi:hypothetical protein